MLSELIDQKKRKPDVDLLSGLVEAADDGDHLTQDELFATTFLLIGAGYETTAHLISNAVLALLRNPQQLDVLRRNRSLLPQAVEEFLRFDGPINIATIRFTNGPIRIGTNEIPANEIVLISLAAANRDPRQFVEPDTLGIAREDIPHLGFGHGIHYCVGAPLARLEGEIAIDRLLDRFDDLTIDGGQRLEYRDSTIVRGLEALPLYLVAGGPRASY
jgi:cytochrome P450